MEPARKMITKTLKFDIPHKHPWYSHQGFAWGDLIKTQGLEPTDIIHQLNTEEREHSGFGNMDMDDSNSTYSVPVIFVRREVPETDEEYFARMQKEESSRTKTLEKEKLEYLRLKAKFENPTIERNENLPTSL